MLKMLVSFVISALLIVVGTGCTKKRDPRLAPGQGENLDRVSDYKDKVFKVKTLSRITLKDSQGNQKAIVPNSTQAVKSKINVSKLKMTNDFYPVNYETDAKLPQSTIFVAKENTTDRYEIHYKLNNTHMILYKVAREEDIPLSERTYKADGVVSDGRLAIPLVGYSITGKYTIAKVENDLGEDTSLLREKSNEDINQSTHLRIDFSRPESFEAVTKTDFIPTELFEGEPQFYYSETIIETPEDGATMVGWEPKSYYYQSLESSNRVKFVLSDDSLEVLDMNLDERLQKSNSNYKKVLVIPFERKGFKISQNGLRESEDDSIHWSNKKYISFKFDKIIRNPISYSGDYDGAGIPDNDSSVFDGPVKVLDIELEDKYFTFTLKNLNTNTQIRYSFLRVEKSNYKPKIHFESDWNKFGYFTTLKPQIDNYQIYSKEDAEKNLLITRFNPKINPNTGKKEIVYHFTKSSPEYLRASAAEAVEEWNKTFKTAGTGITIRLEKRADAQSRKGAYSEVDLGDIRYNAINILETNMDSNLYGFGPSVIDPLTGERVSSTTNIHFTPMRTSMIEDIQNWILMKRGYLEGHNIDNKISGISLVEGSKNAFKSAFSNLDELFDAKTDHFNFFDKNKEFIKQYKENTDTDKLISSLKYQYIDFRKRDKNFGREFDLAVTAGNTHNKIKTQCPDLVKEVESNKKSSDKEVKLTEKCATKLAIPLIKSVIVHEMGHNFGLRHNFYGSTDSANFYPEKNNYLVRTSSIMEYQKSNENPLEKPGLYDIAAIRYGYADKLELKDGRILKLDTKKSIDQNLATYKLELKPFKFCTDEHVFYGVDPMCERHDAGITPSEVVTNIINRYDTLVSLYNYRYDRAYRPKESRLMRIHLRYTFEPLYKFYTQWRVLLAQALGDHYKYLDNMTMNEFNSKVSELINSQNAYAQELKEYKNVSDLVFNFLKKIADTPSKMCVVRNTKKKNLDDSFKLELKELEPIRNELFYSNHVSVLSCSDEPVVKYLEDKGYVLETKNNTLKPEIGFFLNSIQYDKNAIAKADSSSDTYDIIGTYKYRFLASAFLSSRFAFLSINSGYMNKQALKMGLFPSLLDEPDKKERIVARLTSHITSGSFPNLWDETIVPFLNENELASFRNEEDLNFYFPNIAFEKNIITNQMKLIFEGLRSVFNPETMLNNFLKFKGIINRDRTQVIDSKFALTYELPGGLYFSVEDKERNKYSFKLLENYKEIDKSRLSKRIKNEKLIQFIKEMDQLLPKIHVDPKVSNYVYEIDGMSGDKDWDTKAKELIKNSIDILPENKQDEVLVGLINETDAQLPDDQKLGNIKFKDIEEQTRMITDKFIEFVISNKDDEDILEQAGYYLGKIEELKIMDTYRANRNTILTTRATEGEVASKKKEYLARERDRMNNIGFVEYRKLGKDLTYRLFSGKLERMIKVINDLADEYEKDKENCDAQLELILNTLLEAN